MTCTEEYCMYLYNNTPYSTQELITHATNDTLGWKQDQFSLVKQFARLGCLVHHVPVHHRSGGANRHVNSLEGTRISV